jgi:hypothetical protein
MNTDTEMDMDMDIPVKTNFILVSEVPESGSVYIVHDGYQTEGPLLLFSSSLTFRVQNTNKLFKKFRAEENPHGIVLPPVLNLPSLRLTMNST